MLATFVIRVVATGDSRDAVSGHVEAVETGATAVFRNAGELMAFLRRDPDQWEEHT